MEIISSSHAKRRMKWKNLSADEIIKTIESPEKIEDTVYGRKNAYRTMGLKFLKVTYG